MKIESRYGGPRFGNAQTETVIQVLSAALTTVLIEMDRLHHEC